MSSRLPTCRDTATFEFNYEKQSCLSSQNEQGPDSCNAELTILDRGIFAEASKNREGIPKN